MNCNFNNSKCIILSNDDQSTINKSLCTLFSQKSLSASNLPLLQNGSFVKQQSIKSTHCATTSKNENILNINNVEEIHSFSSTTALFNANYKQLHGLKPCFKSLPFKQAPLVFADDNSPMTLFFTKIYCFSNHYMCDRLNIDEQYYMYYKAYVFGDLDNAKSIMATSDPKVMKRIGSEIAHFNQLIWFPISIMVMVIASLQKYEQNSDLRHQLFQTADTLLVEASPSDDRWGVGLGMESEFIRMKSFWRGKNIMGRLLTNLRDRLLERKEYADERRKLLSSCKF